MHQNEYKEVPVVLEMALRALLHSVTIQEFLNTFGALADCIQSSNGAFFSLKDF